MEIRDMFAIAVFGAVLLVCVFHDVRELFFPAPKATPAPASMVGKFQGSAITWVR